MLVAVAGGTGAVGRPTVRALRAAGHDVVLLLRRHPSEYVDLPAPGVHVVFESVRDARRVITAVGAGALVSHVTSLRSEMDPRRLDKIYHENDAARDGVADIMAAVAEATGARLVVQSAAFWYAPGSGLAVEHDDLWTAAPPPIGNSVRALLTMEGRVRAAAGTLLRLGTLYGSHTYYAADGSIGRRIAKRRYPVVGGGDGVTSFLHVEDAAAATVAALDAPAGVYNVVDDDPAPACAWIPAFASARRAPPPLSVPTFLVRIAIGPALTEWMTKARGASNARMRGCGWRPQFASWRDGLRSETSRDASA